MDTNSSSNNNKKKQVQIKQKIVTKKDNIKTFWSEVSLGEKTYNTISNKIINSIKIFIVATRKFMFDDCFTKASSIAYTAIISIVPTITVALTFYSYFSGVGGEKDDLFKKISIFMVEHNLRINIDPIFAALSGLIENAGKIGGISAVIVVFSATALLRSLEKSLNDIWKVQKSRPIFLKVIYYWAILTLGPIMVIAATTVATQVSEIFSSPNYNSAYIAENNHVWVVGNKANILHSKKGNLQFQNITNKNIDFDNQRVFKYNYKNKSFIMDPDFKVEPDGFNKIKFQDIQFTEKTGWIVGNNGIILQTLDNGSSWDLRKWGSLNFNDIHMINNLKGFIAAESGMLLTTEDGGKNWKVYEPKEIISNFNSISFYGDKGIITGGRGIILYTNDAGLTWELRHLKEARRKNRFINLNNVYFVNENYIWIVGDEGTILFSKDGGKEWQLKKFKEVNYHAAYFFDKDRGYIAGDRGFLIFTDNGGEEWHRKKLRSYRINKLLYKNNSIWAIGDTGMIMVSQNNGKVWKGTEGKNLIVFLINFFAPFVFIWLLFLFAYMSIPNMKIPFKYASVGAIFTGSVWVIFILLFKVYIKSFAISTFAIYGALASIPLFLLMIYASSLIILYGAEVAYTLMHPESYRNIKKSVLSKTDIHVYYGITILHYIYQKFENGKGASYFKEIIKAASHKVEEVDFYTKLFQDKKLIIQNADNGYVPANSSQNIKLADLVETIQSITFDIPDPSKISSLKNYMKQIFNNVSEGRKNIIGEITLKDIIETANKHNNQI